MEYYTIKISTPQNSEQEAVLDNFAKKYNARVVSAQNSMTILDFTSNTKIVPKKLREELKGLEFRL